MKMKRISLTVTPETEKRIGKIPKGSRSPILRSLLRAYATFGEKEGHAVAIGATLSEDIEIIMKRKEVGNAST